METQEIIEKIKTVIDELKPAHFKYAIYPSAVDMNMIVYDIFTITIGCTIRLDEKRLYPYSIIGAYVEPSRYHERIAEIFGVQVATLDDYLSKLTKPDKVLFSKALKKVKKYMR